MEEQGDRTRHAPSVLGFPLQEESFPWQHIASLVVIQRCDAADMGHINQKEKYTRLSRSHQALCWTGIILVAAGLWQGMQSRGICCHGKDECS